MNRVLVVVCTLLLLCGCNAGGLLQEREGAMLRITQSSDNPEKKVIAVGPTPATEGRQHDILVADLQAETDAVLLRKVVIGVQSSAPIDSVIADAELEYSGNTYPLSHTETRSDTTDFLVFMVSRSEAAFLISDQKRSLKLRAKFKPSAADERVRAQISSSARNRMDAVRAVDQQTLSSGQKSGAAKGRKHTLRRVGAHVETQAVTATRTSYGVQYEVELSITAFATDVLVPWKAYRLHASTAEYPHGGWYYAIEDTTGAVVSSGSVGTSLESITVAPAGSDFPGSNLFIKEGDKRAVTLSVHHKPQSKVRDRLCFRLDAVSYEINRGNSRLLTKPDSQRTDCVSL